VQPQPIDTRTPLSLITSFAFPLQNAAARREVLIGALWLLIPVVGWLFNMGHRIRMVHRMQQGLPAWPAWNNYPQLLRDGSLTFLGMVMYHTPAMLLAAVAWWLDLRLLYAVAAGLWLLATVAVPVYMSHYCRELDPAEIFDPARAMRRVFQGGAAYWHAWLIALAALGLSFSGLVAFGVGFLITSVWFWQVAGFSFATVFSQKFELQAEPPKGRTTNRE
jgi:hypothetical protein